MTVLISFELKCMKKRKMIVRTRGKRVKQPPVEEQFVSAIRDKNNRFLMEKVMRVSPPFCCYVVYRVGQFLHFRHGPKTLRKRISHLFSFDCINQIFPTRSDYGTPGWLIECVFRKVASPMLITFVCHPSPGRGRRRSDKMSWGFREQ